MYGLNGEMNFSKNVSEDCGKCNLGQGSRWTGKRNWRPLILYTVYEKDRAQSDAISQLFAPGNWSEAQRVPPDVQMHIKGIRFWALIIGNNDYPKAPLSGCVNDAIYMQRYLIVISEHPA